MTVTALLVSHDGARWLPAVLDGLKAQTRAPDRVVAVDTGSTDASHGLLVDRLGSEAVVPAAPATGFGAAVQAGLDHAGSGATDWVWLLHDDSAPAPDALEVLLSAAAQTPSASVLGPKLREWPSLRRLLEVGVTISGTGRRETGLERGEYDQGQHDRSRDVLAVNTAGMLVRREVLDELGGFDPRLPVFGNDLDFGWRAARAGHRTITVPGSVVFHVEAAHRGVRRTPLTGQVRRAERRAMLYTLLANGALWALPFLVVRLLLGSLVRALGLLLVRSPREAYDELVALVTTYLRPDRIVAARIERRRTATVPPREVRRLLAPPWLPYRHGLDFVTDVGTAVAQQAGEVSSARRSRRVDATETGPVPVEAENLPADTGLFSRLLTSPTAAVFVALVVLAVVGMRGLLGSGALSGGALLRAPDTAIAWWDLYLESWHDVGVGSGMPAAPYVLPLAAAGSLLLGKAWLLLDVLFLLAVPVAAFGGYRFLLRATGARFPALWGAVAYGLFPVLSGAVNQGRLGTVAAALLLPWLAHSALFLAPTHSADRRRRAAWRTALWLALLAAFAPLAWPLAVAVACVAVLAGLVLDRAHWSAPGVWGPVAIPLLAVPVLLLPWSLFTPGRRGLIAWLSEAGLPAKDLLGQVGAWDVVLGRAAEVGSAPGWISAGVIVAAVAALLRRDTRGRVLPAWLVLVLGLVAVALLARSGEPVWLGFPMLVVQAAAVCAATFAATGISALISGSSFGWRQPVGLLVVAVAVLSPVVGLGWWVATGVPGPLDRRPVTTVPPYMTDAARLDPDHGVLVIRGDRRSGLEYTVLRGDGQRTGDDTVTPPAADQRGLTDLVTALATSPESGDIDRLGRYGIAFVYAPARADVVLAGNLDSASGLSPASAVRRGARAWQLEATPSDAALAHPDSSVRPWLLAVQLIALLVTAVLAAPTRRVRR
ncbi:MAG TPA: glycosyltransferase family 2 protein [Nocardioidaceae bacterium]|nr:glycosyltransferase family 2 protein [Nocardioidaceae bacterium]